MSLSEATKKIIKATAPVLAEHGPVITTTMYKNMFPKYPEVRTLFNQQHQVVPEGEKFAPQPRSLANAVHAYAANIDNLGVLGGAIERIAEKHVSTLVKAPHYAIVGQELIGALKEVLGDAATPEIVNAWTEGYGFLADVFIKREEEIAKERAAQAGGWEDLRNFTVEKKVTAAKDICSFYLKPSDGGELLTWKAGQYIGIRHPVNGTEHQRNYSVTSNPGDDFIRLTIKKEGDGLMSSALHHLKEGEQVRLTVPCGDFHLSSPSSADTPIVLMGLGVGITPIYPMAVEALKHTPNVHVLQGAKNEDYLPLKEDFVQLKKAHPSLSYTPVFSAPLQSTHTAQRMDVAFIRSHSPANAKYYFTGPGPWIKEVVQGLAKEGVQPNNIIYEYFGPTEI